ncbi:MAG TPA: nicotinamide phosphoribosyltransferase domain-containing protein, partial [Anaerolineae bacterium]
MDNLIMDTDSYKASHFLQYPPYTEGMFSYKAGRLDLIRTPEGYRTLALKGSAPGADSQLVTVFENGQVL